VVTTIEYAWLIPAPPLLAFLVNLFFGKRFREGGAWVSIGTSTVSFLMSAWVLFEVAGGGRLEKSWSWFSIAGTRYELGILIDSLSALLLIIVSGVSLLVLIYSLGYMHDDPDKYRYYAEMSLFSSSMLGLVCANNLLQMFVFWELVGLCSYLLIGFWYHKPSAASAAKKAFLVTRVGDTLLLAGIIILYTTFGTFNFTQIFERLGTQSPGFIKVVMLLIFGGAVGKSAQFPLHVWLPDAMEGPTSVSTLIHSATMVKAGVYLVARMYPAFSLSHDVMTLVAYTGALTAAMAGLIAFNHTDIKKILAYSTISHLGFMMLGLGAGSYEAGLFHLLNHSFFKALLFMAAGGVIHALHTQDIRLMGGLTRKMPVTAITCLIGTLALAGMFPFSGFWSKDAILSTTFEHDKILFAIGAVAALFSALYAGRWFLLIFGPTQKESHARESPFSMTLPLIIMALGALLSGVLNRWLGNPFRSFILSSLPHSMGGYVRESMAAHEPFMSFVPLFSITLSTLALVFVFFVYYMQMIPRSTLKESFPTNYLQRWLNRGIGIDILYYAFADWVGGRFIRVLDWIDVNIVDGFVNGVGKMGIFLAFRVIDAIDVNGVDGAVNGIADLSFAAGERLRRLQTGVVGSYATAIIVGIILLMILMLYVGSHAVPHLCTLIVIWKNMG
jgi:NADH-quinone oxidoreductase subunit L